MLRCLGIDHPRLTFIVPGLDMRLTGVEEHGPVMAILARGAHPRRASAMQRWPDTRRVGTAQKNPASGELGSPLAGYERIEIESETPCAGRGFRTHVPDPLGARESATGFGTSWSHIRRI
jgi:hypothetical protein